MYDEWVADGSPEGLCTPPKPIDECSPGKILFETDAYTLVVMQEDEGGPFTFLAIGEMPDDVHHVRVGHSLVDIEWHAPMIDGFHRSKPIRALTTRDRKIVKLRSLKHGDVVCDMHDGFHDVPIDVHKWIQVDCQVSCDVLDRVLEGVGVTELPTNKHAVLIGESSNGWLQAAYSYDGYKFGMFEFTVCDD